MKFFNQRNSSEHSFDILVAPGYVYVVGDWRL